MTRHQREAEKYGREAFILRILLEEGDLEKTIREDIRSRESLSRLPRIRMMSRQVPRPGDKITISTDGTSEGHISLYRVVGVNNYVSVHSSRQKDADKLDVVYEGNSLPVVYTVEEESLHFDFDGKEITS